MLCECTMPREQLNHVLDDIYTMCSGFTLWLYMISISVSYDFDDSVRLQ